MQRRDVRGAWDHFEENQIREAWDRTQRGLSEVISLLTGTLRWDSADWIPSFNALLPLIVLTSRGKTPAANERELARKWLILATVHAYFSGSFHALLDQILRKLKESNSVRRVWAVTKAKLRRVRPANFETTRLSGPVMSMYVSMIRNNGARDWLTNEPLDGTAIGHNATLSVHHFFPRSLLKKHGYSTEQTNTFANYTVLSLNGNLDAGTEEPATYLARQNISEERLKLQCIPMDKELWRVDRYDDFVVERRKLLAQRANEFLGV